MKFIYKEVPVLWKVQRREEQEAHAGTTFSCCNDGKHIFFWLTSIRAVNPADKIQTAMAFSCSHPVSRDPGWAIGQEVIYRMRIQQNCDERGVMDCDLDRFLVSHPGNVSNSEGSTDISTTRDGEFIIEETSHSYVVRTRDGVIHRFDKDGKHVSSTME
jgi:hypothetical protein